MSSPSARQQNHQSRLLQRKANNRSPSLMSHQPTLGDAAKNLQRSFKILSLLDGSSSLNQALQFSQSGGNILMNAPAENRRVDSIAQSR